MNVLYFFKGLRLYIHSCCLLYKCRKKIISPRSMALKFACYDILGIIRELEDIPKD